MTTIFQSAMDWAAAVLAGLINTIFPAADSATLVKLDSAIDQWNAGVLYQIRLANWFFPVDLLIGLIAYIALVELTLFGIKATRYVASILTVGIIK